MPITAAPDAAQGLRTNTIPIDGLVTDAGANVVAVTANLTVTRAAIVAKSFSPATIAAGGISRLTITISHTNRAVAFTNMAITDPLPLDHVISNPANATTTCGGTLTATPGTSMVALSGAGLGTGATACQIALDVQAPSGTGTAANTIPANTLSTAEGVSYDLAATANLTRTTPGPLTLNKSFAPVFIEGGAPSTLSILIQNVNPGSINLSDVRLMDAFPSGMEVHTAPNASFTGSGCSGGTITATPGASSVAIAGARINANSTCTLSVTVTGRVEGLLGNDIPVGAATSREGVSSDNSPSATLAIDRGANIGKLFSPPIIPVNGTSTLTVVLYNATPGDLTGVDPEALIDTMPAGLVVTGGGATTCAGGTVTTTATTVTLNGGTIPAGETCTVTAQVTAAAAGVYTNDIPVGALQTTAGETNSSPAIGVLRVVELPTITKAFSPASISPGGTSTITFTVGNTNAEPFTGASFTDMLTNMRINAPGPAGGTCEGADSNQFSAGDTELAFDGLTIPANGTCTVTVVVTSSTLGLHPNQTIGVSTAQLASPGNPSNIATLTVLQPPTVTKSFDPPTILAGAMSTLTLTITNPNAVALTFSDPALDQRAPRGDRRVAIEPRKDDDRSAWSGYLRRDAYQLRRWWTGGGRHRHSLHRRHGAGEWCVHDYLRRDRGSPGDLPQCE